jgi:hypothetical protein
MEIENTSHNSCNSMLFGVTKLSKYLAMILFIGMPFVGGYVGYRFAPDKVVTIEVPVSVEKRTDTAKTIALCGKSFTLTTDLYIDSIAVLPVWTKLLTNESVPDNGVQETACHWIIENSKNTSHVDVRTALVKYDHKPVTATSSADAYFIQFVDATGASLGEGNYVDVHSLDVYRVNEMDGSKGVRLGNLKE